MTIAAIIAIILIFVCMRIFSNDTNEKPKGNPSANHLRTSDRFIFDAVIYRTLCSCNLVLNKLSGGI